MATFVSQYRYLLDPTEGENIYEVTGRLVEDVTATDGLVDTQFTFGETVNLEGDPDPYTVFGSFGAGWIGQSDEGLFWLFSNVPTIANGAVIEADTNPFTTCFLAGTRIATPDGPRAVETLVAGDRVLVADGRALPVRWLGVQTVARAFVDPLRSFPVRIAAGALGANLPARDLFLSPDHALLLDGALVHAGALVNGTTVARVDDVPETFRYFHVELDEHALLLAEGVPAESFLNTRAHRRFDNAAERPAALAAPGRCIAEMALPRVKSARQLPPQTRRRLAGQAEAMALEAERAA